MWVFSSFLDLGSGKCCGWCFSLNRDYENLSKKKWCNVLIEQVVADALCDDLAAFLQGSGETWTARGGDLERDVQELLVVFRVRFVVNKGSEETCAVPLPDGVGGGEGGDVDINDQCVRAVDGGLNGGELGTALAAWSCDRSHFWRAAVPPSFLES